MNMPAIQVAVCDDDQSMRALMVGYCERLCSDLDIKYVVQCFEDGDELVGGLAPDVDLLLLDVEMPLLDGMSAAREVRRTNNHVCIVFVTSFECYAVPGYEVGAFRYLLKPLDYTRFARELSGVFLEAAQAKARTLTFKTKEGARCISPSDITVIETGKAHRIAAHVNGERVELVDTSLGKLEDALVEHGFFRVHSAYLINLTRVAYLGTTAVRMADGAEIPVSKHRKRAFKEALTNLVCKEAFGPSWGA